MKEDHNGPPAENPSQHQGTSPQWSRDSSTGKPSLSSGLSFLMYRASNNLTSYLLWHNLLILKQSLSMGCPVSNLWLNIEEFGLLDIGSPVRTDTPMCSETLHCSCLMVLPMYCLLQSRHLYSYTRLEHTDVGSPSLCLKNDPIIKLLLKTGLKSICGNLVKIIFFSSDLIFWLTYP